MATSKLPLHSWRAFPHGTQLRVEVVFRELEDGEILAICTTLRGAYAQAPTRAKAVAELRLVLAAIVASHREARTDIPWGPVELDPGEKPETTLTLHV